MPNIAGMIVSAILPMAGQGTRTGAATPKQYWMVDGEPLFLHTLAALRAAPELHEVVLVVDAAHLRDVQTSTAAGRAAWPFTVRVIQGGSSRHRSILLGLRALAPCDVVVVHDAVRPFVDARTIRDVAAAAERTGAAGCVAPLVDTVLRGSTEEGLVHALDRSAHVASQTPQAFRRGVLLQAYDSASDDDLDQGTECLDLVQRGGTPVELVEGGAHLWKVTYKHDLYAAEHLLRERTRRAALITGGSRGIGAATARQLADRGVRVALVARSEADTRRHAEAIGGIALCGDVGDAAFVKTAFDRAEEAFGPVGIVVNNAGAALLRRVAETEDDEWRDLAAVNLQGAFYVAREAMRRMAAPGRSGVIINVGSSSVNGGRIGQGAYAATKAGMVSLTSTLALEGGPQVQAFAVVPSRTDTDLRRSLYPDEDPSTLLSPETVAEVVTFLATQPLAPLSGQTFYVRR